MLTGPVNQVLAERTYQPPKGRKAVPIVSGAQLTKFRSNPLLQGIPQGGSPPLKLRPQMPNENSATFHDFSLETADGERLPIGTSSVPYPEGAITVTGAFHTTDSAEEAERSRLEPLRGRLPHGIEAV